MVICSGSHRTLIQGISCLTIVPALLFRRVFFEKETILTVQHQENTRINCGVLSQWNIVAKWMNCSYLGQFKCISKICWVKETNQRRLQIWFHLYKFQKQVKENNVLFSRAIKERKWLINTKKSDYFWEGGVWGGEEAFRAQQIVAFKLGAVYNGISYIIPLYALHVPFIDSDIFNIIYNKN